METASQPCSRPSLLERAVGDVGSIASQDGHMPIVDDAVYFDLIGEALDWAAAERGQALSLFMDAATAAVMSDRGFAPPADLSCAVCGDTMPRAWSASAAGCLSAPPGWMTRNDRVFLLRLSGSTLAVFGAYADGAVEARGTFRGAWTTTLAEVSSLLRLLPEAILESTDGAPPSAREALAQRLLHRHIAVLNQRCRHMTMERGNLLSVLHLIKAISDKRNSQIILQIFVDQIARTVPADRCSIVRVWEGESCGHVLASHDDLELQNCVIALDKYPEVRAALEKADKIVVNDVPSHPLTRPFADALQKAGIVSLLVIPVMLHDPLVGSLLLRAARHNAQFSEQEINFFEVVAETASNALERAHLLENIQRANVRLEQMAITDALTGLFNRRYLNMRLEEEFERTARYHVPLSCIMLDTDHFKEINDRYGHVTGDGVLREIAERMTANSRRVDLLARYGGDEFAIILPQTPLRGAMTEATRLCAAIGGQPFRDIPEEAAVSVSVGVAEADPATMHTFEDLLRAADAALYRAKQQGKNRASS